MEKLKERSRQDKKTDGGLPQEAPFFLIFFTKNN